MRATLLFVVGVSIFPAIAMAGDDLLSMNPFPGGRGLEAPAGQQFKQDALASAAALKAADDDLHARNQAQPDGRYIKVLQETFQKSRSVTQNFVLPSVPVSDENLLSDPTFALNLQRLFQRQAANITSMSDSADIVSNNARVIGGLPIPSAVDIVAIIDSIHDAPDALCSGEIIGRISGSTAILTAAHCVCEADRQTVRVGQIVSEDAPYVAYLVSHSFLFNGSCPVRETGETIEKYRIDIEHALAGRDIAVVVTDQPIPLRLGTSRPLLNAQQYANWISTNRASGKDFSVRAAGYGYTTTTAGGLSGSGQRMFADIVVASPQCVDFDAAKYGCAAHGPVQELVAQGRPFHEIAGPVPDTCNGDSGGPIYANVIENGKTYYYTIGITSRGTNATCGAGGIYSLITSDAVTVWLHDKFGASFMKS